MEAVSSVRLRRYCSPSARRCPRAGERDGRARSVSDGLDLAVARVAGIMAAKKTSELIPMCHPLNITSVEIDLTAQTNPARVDIEALVRVSGKTGVEMEALTAVSAAGLTIYDMCKAVDREMTIGEIRLVKKSGGKSGTFIRKE